MAYKTKKTFDSKCPYCSSNDTKGTKLENKVDKDICETEYVCNKCDRKFVFVEFI